MRNLFTCQNLIAWDRTILIRGQLKIRKMLIVVQIINMLVTKKLVIENLLLCMKTEIKNVSQRL